MLPKRHVHSPLILSRAFYFFYYGALAAFSPFLVLYYDQLGFSGTQIGILRGIPPLIVLLSAPLWGALSDAFQQHKRFLLIAIGTSVILVYALSLSRTFSILMVIVALHAFCSAPISSLIDNSVIQMLKGQEGKYGRQRLWGAVGWGSIGPIAGWLSEQSGQQWIFYSYMLLMICGWIVASCMPIRGEGKQTRFWHDIKILLGNKQWSFFLLSILLGGLHLSLSNTYLFLYLKKLGTSETLMGFSMTVAIFSELPVWFFSNTLLRKLGSKGMLILSFLTCAVQALGYTLLPVPWLILVLQLLHGPSYSVMWAAGVAYAAEISTENTRATAQGMFGGITMGLRTALGTLVGGLLYDSAGVVTTFRFGGVMAIIGLVIFIVNTRKTAQSERS